VKLLFEKQDCGDSSTGPHQKEKKDGEVERNKWKKKPA